MRRLFSTLCVLILMLAVSHPASAQQTQRMESIRRSVIHLYALGYDDSGKVLSRWTGTGFAVGIAGEDSDTFLTNYHVISGSGKYAPDHVKLWMLLDDARFLPDRTPREDSAVECEVLASYDGYPDVAVIRFCEDMPGFKALPMLSSKQVMDGTAVTAFGFPGLKDTHYGADSGPEDVAVTSGVIRDHLIMASAGNTRSLIHTAAIQHGNSGGPLVNADGVVVGLNAYGFEEDVSTELFCSVYIDYGMKLLDDLGIAYTTVPGPSRITVLVANTLHMPEISDGAAMCVFAAACAAAAAFALYFLKTLREAIAEVRGKLSQRKNRTGGDAQ